MCRQPARFPVCDVMAVLSRCGPGYYYSSTSNGLTCTPCDPGSACYNGRRFPCPPGFYASQSGSTNCTVCPAGHSCSDSSQDPQQCSAGQYATQGSTDCRQCVDGTGSESGSSDCTTALASGGECVCDIANYVNVQQQYHFLSSSPSQQFRGWCHGWADRNHSDGTPCYSVLCLLLLLYEKKK